MITGLYNDKTLEALQYIFHSPLLFQVCGSRFHGDPKPYSDYDFMIEEHQELSLQLVILDKWEKAKSSDSGYLDRNTLEVLEKGKVQLIFVKNMAARIEARQMIKDRGLDRHKTESWEQCYQDMQTELSR